MSTPQLKGVAQNVNDSIRTNETSLTHLEEQIDILTDALVAVNSDPMEMQATYEEERAKLLAELSEKSALLNRTLEELQDREVLHEKELGMLQERGRMEKDALVGQLRTSQAELMDHYSKVDLVENEKEQLEWELSRAEEKYKRQNENLIDQNNALMHALQDEQNKSRDVIEELERSLQTVPLDLAEEFKNNIANLSSSDFNPTSESSPLKNRKMSESALEVLKKIKKKFEELGLSNDELVQLIDELEKAIIRETALSKRYSRKCNELNAELDNIKTNRPTKRQLENVEYELEENKKLLLNSQQKVQDLEKVLVATLSKHEHLVADLNKTIDSQDSHIEELKRKNFYPKLMDDLKKENAKLKEEVKKLNSLVKQSPNRKVGGLKNKFEEKMNPQPTEGKKQAEEDNSEIIEKIEVRYREEVNHLKGKLTILEKKLNQSLEENTVLNQELNEAIEQLDDNSFNYESLIQDLHSKLENSVINDPSISVDDSVMELRKHLQEERTKNETLSKMLNDSKKDDHVDLPPPVELRESFSLKSESPEPLPPPPPDISITTPTPPRPPVYSPKPNPIKVLTNKLNSSLKETEKKKAALQHADDDIFELTERINELEDQLADQNAEVSKLRVEVKRGVSVSVTSLPVQEEIEQLEQTLEDSIHDKIHLEETIDILSEEHETQVAALNRKIEELDAELQGALSIADPNSTSLAQQLDDEKKLRAALEEKLENLEFQLLEKGKDSEESLNNLQHNLDEAEKMCEQLMFGDDEDLVSLDSNDFKKLLKGKDSQISKLVKENHELKAEIDQLNGEFAEISTEIAEADNQYGQRIENLQKQLRMNQEDHQKVVKDLEEEMDMLNEMLEEEKHTEKLEKLERENVELSEECRILTDRLASDILNKISPVDEKRDVISEIKDHYEKGHSRLKTDIELKNEKIADLQEDIKRLNINHSRKVASLKESQDIKDERHKLKNEEHLLTIESLKKELDQLKKVNRRFEENLESKNVEFNEVVTKLLNLENLIEIQQDNMLGKDEQVDTINRQLKNLKAELEIAQQRHNILREESIALDILETSLNEVSEHDRQQEAEISNLKIKLEKAIFDKELTERDRDLAEMKLKNGAGAQDTANITHLRKTIEDLELQIEDLKDNEHALKDQISKLVEEKSELFEDLPNKSRSELERNIALKEKIIEEKTNELNTMLSKQDKTKQDLVTKNIELQNSYNELLQKLADLETENECLLDDIDNNFKVQTASVKQLESEIKDLKNTLAEKEEVILKSDEIINQAEANNLVDSQAFFESRKQLETEITYLKTKLMDYEGGDAVRRASSVHSVWLEDTSSLNQVIGEKDRQIRDLRDSLKRSSAASSHKGSVTDLVFKSSSLGSIPPPTDLEINGDYTADETISIDKMKKQIEDMHVIMDKKDDEYSKLYQKFKEEIERQTTDSNVYNSHIKKLQNMVSLFEQQADKSADDNKQLIKRSTKSLNDVNQSLNNLTDELMLENERSNEVLGELDLLKEDIEALQHDVSRSEDEGANIAISKLLDIEDTVQMTVEEHQCSLDHYQLLLQTTQQEMAMIVEELKSEKLEEREEVPTPDYLAQILDILHEKVTLLGDKLTETKDEVTSSRFRGSQNGKSERENAIVIEQAELRCTKYENEIESIKNMLGQHDLAADSEHFIKVTENLQELSAEMGDLKDLLSLKKSTPVLAKIRPALPRSPLGLESSEYEGESVLERVSLQEIDGLELITHDLRHQLREKIAECETLRDECESLRTDNTTMNQSMRELQKVFGGMLSEKEHKLDDLNNTISAERSVLETKLSQLSDVIVYKDKSEATLKKSLSFEQGRVQQLREDLDNTYEKTFEHIKEYEGRVSTISERLNLQQQQVKAKLESFEEEIEGLKKQLGDYKTLLKDKEHSLVEADTSHRKEMRSTQRLLKKSQDESMRYHTELEELRSTFSQSQGSLDLQLSQYGDIMTKFKHEISEEKEAFQNSLKKLNYLVEDRTEKIREYERIVADLQQSLCYTQEELTRKNELNETLVREQSKLKLSLQTSPPANNDNVHHWRNKANKADNQIRKMKQTIDDVRYRHETQLAKKDDELLSSSLSLEKVRLELDSKTERYNAIQNEVKSLKLEIEAAGSDNQVKDLQQKISAKQSEIDDAVYHMNRHQREADALKDVLSSYQHNAGNDVANKISEYETTIADYEVQTTMLKKNISDLHTQLHNTCDERQKVVDKAQNQISVYQRRLEQMNDRVEEAKTSATRESASFKESKRHYQRQIAMLEEQLKDTQTGGEHFALRQKIGRLERQLNCSSPDKTGSSPELQQRFELAVKRADHLQEQVDAMRKTNKRIQKTVEDLWAENTQLLKELNKAEPAGRTRPERKSHSGRTRHKQDPEMSVPNIIGSADI